MYIPLHEMLRKYNIKPKGVIHCGANDADEHQEYIDCGIESFVYIEPCEVAFKILSERIKDKRAILINVACGAEEKEMTMFTSRQNKGMSNSLLKSNLHSIQHPDILFDDTEVVKMVTLDSLPIEKEKYNILVTDCEGYDGQVMLGAKETLSHIDLVYSEVNRDMTRDGNMLIEEFDDLLFKEGFKRVETYWPSPNLSWGDACFCRV